MIRQTHILFLKTDYFHMMNPLEHRLVETVNNGKTKKCPKSIWEWKNKKVICHRDAGLQAPSLTSHV